MMSEGEPLSSVDESERECNAWARRIIDERGVQGAVKVASKIGRNVQRGRLRVSAYFGARISLELAVAEAHATATQRAYLAGIEVGLVAAQQPENE